MQFRGVEGFLIQVMLCRSDLIYIGLMLWGYISFLPRLYFELWCIKYFWLIYFSRQPWLAMDGFEAMFVSHSSCPMDKAETICDSCTLEYLKLNQVKQKFQLQYLLPTQCIISRGTFFTKVKQIRFLQSSVCCRWSLSKVSI